MEQIRPLLLAVLDTFETGEVQKSLRLMVSWAARLLISGGLLGGGVLENSYSQLAIKVRQGSITTARQLSEEFKAVPSDSQFQSKFAIAYTSKANLARYYLRVLENQVRGDPEPALIPNSNQEVVNLEHILPQNPSSAWGHIDPETARDYYNRLGNFALLQSRQNTLIGNAGFDEKRMHYKTSPFVLTSLLAEYTEWGPKQIDERQAKLAELAVEAWPIRI